MKDGEADDDDAMVAADDDGAPIKKEQDEEDENGEADAGVDVGTTAERCQTLELKMATVKLKWVRLAAA
jgi:hypothetical protein